MHTFASKKVYIFHLLCATCLQAIKLRNCRKYNLAKLSCGICCCRQKAANPLSSAWRADVDVCVCVFVFCFISCKQRLTHWRSWCFVFLLCVFMPVSAIFVFLYCICYCIGKDGQYTEDIDVTMGHFYKAVSCVCVCACVCVCVCVLGRKRVKCSVERQCSCSGACLHHCS